MFTSGFSEEHSDAASIFSNMLVSLIDSRIQAQSQIIPHLESFH